jgi:hypothetical protein
MVLLMLANYADQAGRCYPSMKVLSEECGLSLAQKDKLAVGDLILTIRKSVREMAVF